MNDARTGAYLIGLLVLVAVAGSLLDRDEGPERLPPLPAGFERGLVTRLPFSVTDLAWLPDEERVLLAVGSGVARVHPGGSFEWRAIPDPDPGRLGRSGTRVVDLDGDGTPELLRPAEAWVSPLEVIDATGRRLWSAETEKGVSPEGTTWSDFDRDGRLELLVYDHERFRLYSDRGELVSAWSHSESIVDLVPWSLDGAPGVLAACGGDGLRWLPVRGGRSVDVPVEDITRVESGGASVEIHRVGGFANSVALARPAAGTEDPRVVAGRYDGSQRYALLGPGLETLGPIGEGDVPRFVRTTDVTVAGRPYVVSLVNAREQRFPAGYAGSTLWLRVYDGETLVGGEGLEDPAGAEGEGVVLPHPDGGFLVGYGSFVWRYGAP